jgi:NAD+ synthase
MTGIETYVVSMPINQNMEELIRARKHIKWLESNFDNIKNYEFDLTNVFQLFKKNVEGSFNSDLAFANTKSRIRMITLYQISTSINGIVVGTGNKVEDFGVGFFTKYGDGGVDISPIADLNKSQVRILSKELGIINEIIEAEPTDGLWEDKRNDEEQIGASYEELEWAMETLKNNKDLLLLNSNFSERQLEVLKLYDNFHKKNLHKMIPIPVFKI